MKALRGISVLPRQEKRAVRSVVEDAGLANPLGRWPDRVRLRDAFHRRLHRTDCGSI